MIKKTTVLLQTIALIIIISLFYSFKSNTNNETGSSDKLYNKNKQLIADTTILADSRIASFFASRFEPTSDLYMTLLENLIFPYYWIESGCYNTMIIKVEIKKDTTIEYGFEVSNVILVSEDGPCEKELFEVNKKNFEGLIFHSQGPDNFFVHIPIKFKRDFVSPEEYIPHIKKTIKNGYLEITVRSYYI